MDDLHEVVRNNGHSPSTAETHGPEYILDDEYDYDELDSLRQEAADLGVDVYDASRQRAIHRRRVMAAQRNQDSDANQTAREFLRFKQQVAAVTGRIILGLTLFTGYILPPLTVVGLWIVEIQRMFYGVQYWNAPGFFLVLTSVVTVSAYISLMFVRARMVSQTGEGASYQWSLGLALRKVGYLVGWGSGWAPRERTQLNKLDNVAKWLGWLIVGLGTLGALRGELMVFDGWWVLALKHIAFQSELVPFAELAGGMATTWILLQVLHFEIELAYSQYEQILPEDQIVDFFGVSAAAFSTPEADRAEAQYWRQVIARKRRELE